jgi:hypothetical protein
MRNTRTRWAAFLAALFTTTALYATDPTPGPPFVPLRDTPRELTPSVPEPIDSKDVLTGFLVCAIVAALVSCCVDRPRRS